MLYLRPWLCKKGARLCVRLEVRACGPNEPVSTSGGSDRAKFPPSLLLKQIREALNYACSLTSLSTAGFALGCAAPTGSRTRISHTRVLVLG